ncbi:tRNA lysidine(34) synthetase TilS [Chitinophaga niabensis]|uniref:tRNA(Ile)-lysidine synthase n=1 Tax=Chitinophaga niabensis TaxID=536979 RepID=A0A1N6ECJ3_9BACT|nr:tRNA lysidine(34) synthetase TilS [Chitinophaga niabensis]SIN80681.1 tRNA(Ile)-lysidine synthase [Chitinophaga niabensis]
MLQQLRSYITKEQLFTAADPLLLAVSGGLDSIVLTHLCVQAGIKVEMAHCNFQLRGAESERDETFVRTLAESYGIPLFVRRFDTETYAAAHKRSIQVAARELRYQWLEELRQERGLSFIATAHHMQDNVETVWMNLSKGTGIAGLHGILPVQGRIVRPLLFATREEIKAYADAENLQHVEDSSNTTDKYTRNFFRHQVLPRLEEVLPEVVKNTGSSIERFREAEILYRQAVEIHKKKLIEQRGEEYFIPILKLQQAVPLATIAYEILKPFQCSTAQAAQVVELLNSEPGKWIATATHRIVRDRKWLIITPLEATASTHFIIEEAQHLVQLPDMLLKLEQLAREGFTVPATASIACLDLQQVQFPLILRRWKKGDYFYPLGMAKKKKLSRFFIDQKLSLPEKEKVWVLESHKRIIWVAGMRIDDRFKITDKTRKILKLELA